MHQNEGGFYCLATRRTLPKLSTAIILPTSLIVFMTQTRDIDINNFVGRNGC